jgi:putative oxidoreductase
MTDSSTTRVEDVHGSGIYPATGPFPEGPAAVRSPAAFAHPEQRDHTGRRRQRLETAALIAGRLIFGGFFLYNGINHFLNRKMLVDYARSKEVPAPDAVVAASGLMILAGGLSVLTGVQPKVGAGLISAFLLGVSPQMHAFWKEEDAQQRIHEMVNFTKNMALVGASFLVAAHPEPWPGHPDLGSRGGALVPVRT